MFSTYFSVSEIKGQLIIMNSIKTFCDTGSYEDWEVDELIVEGSWKRQAGGN